MNVDNIGSPVSDLLDIRVTVNQAHSQIGIKRNLKRGHIINHSVLMCLAVSRNRQDSYIVTFFSICVCERRNNYCDAVCHMCI